jgi:ribonuclease HI
MTSTLNPPSVSPDLPATLIFADGACSGNPGPGGWSSIIVLGNGTVLELGGRDPQTTNNRMELMAVIQPLQDLGHPWHYPMDLGLDETKLDFS